MSKKALMHAAILAISFAPLMVLAQTGGIEDFIEGTLGGIVKAAIQFLMAVATLVFIFGIIKYMTAGGDSEKAGEAKGFIIWSIVGFAAMLGIWGIATFLVEGLGFDTGEIPENIYN